MKAEEPIVDYDKLNPDAFYTYWDYLKWQFTERVELIRGKVFKMSPAPSVDHQIISVNISRVFFNTFHKHACQSFSAPFDVRLPIPGANKDTTVVQPDLCVICDSSKLKDRRGCDGTPDLVVEILSPGNSKHDIKTKFELYEASGVKEYWIIYPSERTVMIYILQHGQFIGLRPFADDMTVQSSLFPALSITVEDVFYNLPMEKL